MNRSRLLAIFLAPLAPALLMFVTLVVPHFSRASAAHFGGAVLSLPHLFFVTSYGPIALLGFAIWIPVWTFILAEVQKQLWVSALVGLVVGVIAGTVPPLIDRSAADYRWYAFSALFGALYALGFAFIVRHSGTPVLSNQPLHPTPTAAEAPASGAGERRR